MNKEQSQQLISFRKDIVEFLLNDYSLEGLISIESIKLHFDCTSLPQITRKSKRGIYTNGFDITKINLPSCEFYSDIQTIPLTKPKNRVLVLIAVQVESVLHLCWIDYLKHRQNELGRVLNLII